MDTETLRWDNLVGEDGAKAVEIIKKETGFTNVDIVPPNTPITKDYRTDRVRIFVDEQGKVQNSPRVG